MKDFRKIVEEWASSYKPMQHTPGKTGKNQRFFLFDSIVAISSFASKFVKVQSPCVGYEFQAEGMIRGGKIRPRHVVYFMVKTEGMDVSDKNPSADAVMEAKMHMLKFIAWIREQRDNRPELWNVNVEESSYSTFGPFLNNWYAVFIELEDVETFNLCVDPADYLP